MDPYEPKTLPLDCIDWPAHIGLIGQAREALGRYDGMLRSMVNPMLLLSPLTTQEAVLSSRIEGTRASMEEVLRFEADAREPIEPSREADIQEILNYRRAMAQAVDDLETRPFSLNLLRQLHATLLNSVRGRDKAPGRFRPCQNYVLYHGETYVPPVWQSVDPAMANWERYLHADQAEPLVQLAVAKAQFELIHPFLDGNGRLGRMLIPIFLFEKRLLSRPVFYLSAYLEEHRDEYIRSLQGISRQDDWNGWVAFFLTALVEQAQSNTEKTQEIVSLYERMKAEIPRATRSQYAIQAIDALFDRPIFRRADFVQQSGIPSDSARRIFDVLRKEGVIQELRPASGRRGAIMDFPELLQITKE